MLNRADNVVNYDLSLGSVIRRYRIARGLTMEGLGAAAGLSTAMISKVEAGNGNPSINSLRQIANALGVPVAVLFAQEDASLVTEEVLVNNKRVYGYNGATYTVLVSPTSRDTKFLLLEAEPGAERGTKNLPHDPHEGYEQAMVLEGELTVSVADATHILRPYDSISYPSTLPHSWV